VGYPLEWVTTCDKRFDQWIPWPIVSRNDSWGAKHDRQKNHFTPKPSSAQHPTKWTQVPKHGTRSICLKPEYPWNIICNPKKWCGKLLRPILLRTMFIILGNHTSPSPMAISGNTGCHNGFTVPGSKRTRSLQLVSRTVSDAWKVDRLERRKGDRLERRKVTRTDTSEVHSASVTYIDTPQRTMRKVQCLCFAVPVCAQEHGRYYPTPSHPTSGAPSDPLFGALSHPMVL